MTREGKLRMIEKLHRHEREFNLEMGIIDKKIAELMKRKKKLQRCVSGAYKYRNVLINEAYSEKEIKEDRQRQFIQNALDTVERLGLKSNFELLKMDYIKEMEITKNIKNNTP